MSDQSPNNLEETKTRLEVYRHEMNLAKFAEGRLRSQRDHYKALRNKAIQEKSVLEKQLAAMTAELQEQRKEDAEARANIVVEAEGLRESLFATKNDRDTYLQSLEASRAEAEAIRQSWAREKELLDKVSLTLKDDLEASREETSGLRRSLADEDRERRDALERIQSELDGVRRERETLVHSSAASRKEVDNLRQSLDDAKALERETSEALLKVQQDSKDNVAALRTSLGKEKAGHKKTRKRITDATDAKALLEEELKVSLVIADEQKEAVDKLQRELASVREEHVAALARLTEHLDLAQAQSEGISSYAHSIFQANLEASKALEAAQQDMEEREENDAITIALLRTSLVKEREWRKKFEDVEEDTQETWEGSAAAEEPLGTQNDSDGDSDAPSSSGFADGSDEEGREGSEYEMDAEPAPSNEEEIFQESGSVGEPSGVADDNEETPGGSDELQSEDADDDHAEDSEAAGGSGWLLSDSEYDSDAPLGVAKDKDDGAASRDGSEPLWSTSLDEQETIKRSGSNAIAKVAEMSEGSESKDDSDGVCKKQAVALVRERKVCAPAYTSGGSWCARPGSLLASRTFLGIPGKRPCSQHEGSHRPAKVRRC